VPRRGARRGGDCTESQAALIVVGGSENGAGERDEFDASFDLVPDANIFDFTTVPMRRYSAPMTRPKT